LKLERRSTSHANLRLAPSSAGVPGKKVVGHASVFDVPATVGGMTEVVRPGAFTRTLREAKINVVGSVNHDVNLLLGRSASRTLRLSEDSRGLRFEIDLPDTTVGNDLRVLMSRGDLSECSFAFSVPEGGERITRTSAGVLRELIDLDLYDVAIVADAAYSGTSATLASAQHAARTAADLRRDLDRRDRQLLGDQLRAARLTRRGGVVLHEAHHADIVFNAGGEITDMYIDPAGSSGTTHFRCPDPLDELDIALAGVTGTLLFSAKPDLAGCERDLRLAREISRKRWDQDSPPNWVMRGLMETIEDDLPRTLALAVELDRKGRLTGEEATRVLRAASGRSLAASDLDVRALALAA